MNAPDEKRRLMDEFQEFKELLRQSASLNLQKQSAEQPPVVEPAKPAAVDVASERTLSAAAGARSSLGSEAPRTLDDDLAAIVGAPHVQSPAPESAQAENGARRGWRPIYLAAALVILGIGVGATTYLLSDAPLDEEPETATTETAPLTAEEATSTEAPARDAARFDSTTPEAPAPSSEPKADSAGAEPATPSEAAVEAAPHPREALRQTVLPEPKQEEVRPAAVPLDGGVLTPSAASPPVAPLFPQIPAAPAIAPAQADAPAQAQPEAAPAQTAAPKRAAPAKPNDRAKPAQAAKPAQTAKPAQPAKPAKPKAVDTPSKPKQSPSAEASPPPPPAEATQPLAAPAEQPGMIERAVDAVKDLGKMATGVIP